MPIQADLIYDIGMHKGEDTDFYLKKGYRVLAVEANPELVVFCRERFASEIQSGKLKIVEGAIAPLSAGDRVRFFLNSKASIWGTIDRAWVTRNAEWGAESVEIEVGRVDAHRIFNEHGIPFFSRSMSRASTGSSCPP